MDRKQILLLALLAISIAFLIAGIVMLAVGIHKANHKCDDAPPAPTCPAPTCPAVTQPPPPPSTPPPDYSSISAVYTSSHHNIVWNSGLYDPTSDQFKTAAAQVSNDILTALNDANKPSRIVVNKFFPDTQSGVEAYCTLFYSHIVDPKAQSVITKELTDGGLANALFADPISQCNGSPIPPPNRIPATPTPYPPGVICDATVNNADVVFLVDIAVPVYGNYDDKMTYIREFLSDVDMVVNLDQGLNWNQQFYLIPYYGSEVYTIESSPSSDHKRWTDAVNTLTSNLNKYGDDSHNLATGLEYVVESLGRRLKNGIPRTLVIITDGIDFEHRSQIAPLISTLKDQFFTISTVSVSTSQLVNTVLRETVTDFSHFFSIPSYSWLNNAAIKWSAAQWICQAYFPIDPPAKTAPPLRLTTQPPVTTGPTLPPTTTPYGNCIVDVIFLIDESQTMLDMAFDDSLTFAQQLATSMSDLHQESKFAIVTFNSELVYSSGDFFDVKDFSRKLKNINHISANADFTQGFDEARTIIKTHSRYTKQNVRPLIIFITDGDKAKTKIEETVAITTDLRRNFRTEIIGIGVNPYPWDVDDLKKAIGVDAVDQFTKSAYFSVKSGDDLVKNGMDYLLPVVKCDDPLQPVVCGMDFTFVIETSYALTPFHEIEKYVVINTINNFNDKFGPFAGKISFVYFSTPDDFSIPEEAGRSGILFDHLDNTGEAIQRIKLGKGGSLPSGGASDIKTGMQLAKKVVDQNVYGNDQYVIFVTRGLYIDGNATNCCDDPAGAAAALREKAFIQGIVIGHPPREPELDSLTSAPSLDANKLINDLTNHPEAAKSISDALKPLVEQRLKDKKCQPLPPPPAPCSDAIDVTIAWHAKSAASLKIVQDFISQDLLKTLFGGELSNVVQTKNSPIRLMLATQEGDFTQVVSSYLDFRSPQDYAARVQNVAPPLVSIAPSFSGLYNTIHYYKTQNGGRPYATDIVLIITDDVNAQDADAATKALQNLSPVFVRAITVGPIKLSDAVTTIQADTIDQLNVQNIRSANVLVNELAGSICKVVTTPAPVPTTVITTPFPAPVVQPREVWPDVTILVDTAFDGGNGMTDRRFQLVREMVKRNFLNNMYIDDTHSRVSLATFGDRTNVACTYGDIHGYFDLSNCLRNNFIYDVIGPLAQKRDLAGALKSLKSTVFDIVKGDFRPSKENFLIIFTTGRPDSDASDQLLVLNALGIRTVLVDLGGNFKPAELSAYGPGSMSVTNWDDDVSGIIGKSNVGDDLYKMVTCKCSQALSRYFADFYFIVDESAALKGGKFSDVRTFVGSFVNQLTLDAAMSRVAIVPYAADVLPSLELTADRNAYIDYFNNKFQYSTPATADANVGAAIKKVSQMKGANVDRATYVIYITNAEIASGSDQGKAFINDPNAYPIVLQTNPKIKYSGDLAPYIYTLADTPSLNNWMSSETIANQMNSFFGTLDQPLIDYYRRNPDANNQVNADIAFSVDLTGLDANSFINVQQYLVNFVSSYTVSGNLGARFGLDIFNGMTKVAGSFGFSYNQKNVVDTIKALKFVDVADKTTSDIVGSLARISDSIIAKDHGWRNGPTYVVVLTSGKKFNKDTALLSKSLSIQKRAKLGAIQLTGQIDTDFMAKIANFNRFVASPDLLNIDAAASKDLQQNLRNSFVKYDKELLITDVAADFIFMVDNNSNLGAKAFGQLMTWLQNFLKLTNNFDTTTTPYSRMAVYSYDSNGIDRKNSFTLDQFPKADDISTQIGKLQYKNSIDDSAIVNATETIYLEVIQPSPRPTFLIDIASSKKAPETFYYDFVYNLNRKAFTFAYVVSAADPFDYIKQFLGPDGTDNVLPSADFTNAATINKIKAYATKEYGYWLDTYGN